MKELQLNKDSLLMIDEETNMPMLSHKVIAEQLGIKQENVLSIVDRYLEDFEEVGCIFFKNILSKSGRGDYAREAMMDEKASTLLLTYSKNTPQARKLKIRLVKDFFEVGNFRIYHLEETVNLLLEAHNRVAVKQEKIVTSTNNHGEDIIAIAEGVNKLSAKVEMALNQIKRIKLDKKK